MRLAKIALPFVALLLLAACEKQPPAQPPAPAPVPLLPEPVPTPAPPPKVEITQGILDYSRWTKWIQSPPRVLLVGPLDSTTQKLIASQTRIFTTLVAPPAKTEAASTDDVQAQLDATKAAFPAKGRFYSFDLQHPLDKPHHDRWDSYRRTVNHATLTNLPSIITQLERKITSDLGDLEPQLRSSGVAGAQARADTAWLQETMTRQVANLKAVGKANYVSPTSPATVAREEWTRFETEDLGVIKKVIDAITLTESPLDEIGNFSLKGRGQIVAVVTVAGRQLYFTPQTPGELRFLNLTTSLQN